MARDAAKRQQHHEGQRRTGSQQPQSELGDYGSPQGGAGDSQSQNRGSAGIGGEERKPHGGQGQYDSEQGKSDSQQHAQDITRVRARRTPSARAGATNGARGKRMWSALIRTRVSIRRSRGDGHHQSFPNRGQ